MQEQDGKPRTNIRYEKLQASTLVTAAAVARFTNPYVLQLIIFKEVTMEVWEVNQEHQTKVANGVLEKPVIQCCALEASKVIRNSRAAVVSPIRLDCLLVTDGSGGLAIWEWNATLSDVQASGRIDVHFSSELQPAAAVLPSTPVFSCPLYLPSRGSGNGQPPGDGEQGGRPLKVEGTTLVAMSLYQAMLGVLYVEWTALYPTLSTECAVRLFKPPITPRVTVHFLPLPAGNAIPGPMVAIANPYVIRDLAFLAADTGNGYGALDLKGRPLLVSLSSQQGFIYHTLRLQCVALDLSGTYQLRPGPWEIRNLNPTTSLLVPWSFSANPRDVEGTMSSKLEMGLQSGTAILAVSSASILLVEASGRRTSIPLHLDALPTCWNKLPQNRLVVGDDAGGLHVLEVSNWMPTYIMKVVTKAPLPPVKILLHVLSTRLSDAQDLDLEARKQHFEEHIIFIMGHMGDCQLLSMTNTFDGERSGAALNDQKPAWSGRNWAMESSPTLERVCPVRDFILVKESTHNSDPFLLLLCGTSPTSTMRKGSLVAPFQLDTIVDAKLLGTPQLLPFYAYWGSEHHTHILISYPTVHVSEVVTTNGTKTGDTFMTGLERRRCTLTLSALPGGWFIQITETSIRVLGKDSSRNLQAEWKPPPPTPDSPRDLNRAQNIHHAALTPEGAVLVTGETVHSVQLDYLGVPHTISSVARPHQVSALGMHHVGDVCFPTIAREIVVILAQWTSNTVHLLSWPNLEELLAMDACTAPVLSVALGWLAMNNHLFAGTADGNLVCYKLSDIKRSSNIRENEEVNFTKCVTPEVTEDVGESKTMLRRIQNMGNMLTKPSSKESEGEQIKRPQYSLKHGKNFKVGSIVTFIEFGCFNGGGVGSNSNCETSNAMCGHECLYIWSERSLVLLPRLREDFHIVKLHCSSHVILKSTRLHTKEHPHGLVSVTTGGQLVDGHLNLSTILSWQVIQIKGTAMHLVHHESSGCAAITSIDGISSSLHIVHVESMLQVLTVELESKHFPTVLTTLQLPHTMCSHDEKKKECIVVATQTLNGQETRGLLSFFDIQATYCNEKEVKYELLLLGLHPLEEACYSMCMVDTPSNPSSPLTCTMCTLDSLPINDDPWLLDIFRYLKCASEHWSRCCSDPGALQKGINVARGPSLALGFRGKVKLLYAFVGASEACMLLVPSVAAALDASFFPRAGGSCVTALYPVSKRTLLVVEILHGLSVFELAAESLDVVQLAWQPCLYPLEAVMPLSDDLYLLALHGNGCEVLERDYVAEAAFQIQERIRKDLERELMTAQGQVQDGTSGSTVDMEVIRSSLESLPRLKPVAAAAWSSIVLHLYSGSLSLESMPLIRMPMKRKMVQTIILATPTGEVGTITVTQSPVYIEEPLSTELQ